MLKKIVITGGYGFIGSNMTRHFLKKGFDVIILEHPCANVPKDLKDVPVIRADITDENTLKDISVEGVDAVLHLAGQASGEKSFYEPVLDIKLNILGTLNVINWCLANKIDRILFASSFNVYGDHPECELYSEDLTRNPKSVYAISKMTCENLLKHYAQPKGLKWNVLRMFNVYGPGQNIARKDQGVVGIFMHMLMESSTVEVKGRLDRFRDIIFIEDVIQGWDRVLCSEEYNTAFNLGTGRKTTFLELIQTLAEVMGKKDSLVIKELEGTPGDMLGCVADISQISTKTGYTPKYALKDGLSIMLKWVNTEYNQQ